MEYWFQYLLYGAIGLTALGLIVWVIWPVPDPTAPQERAKTKPAVGGRGNGGPSPESNFTDETGVTGQRARFNHTQANMTDRPPSHEPGRFASLQAAANRKKLEAGGQVTSASWPYAGSGKSPESDRHRSTLRDDGPIDTGGPD